MWEQRSSYGITCSASSSAQPKGKDYLTHTCQVKLTPNRSQTSKDFHLSLPGQEITISSIFLLLPLFSPISSLCSPSLTHPLIWPQVSPQRFPKAKKNGLKDQFLIPCYPRNLWNPWEGSWKGHEQPSRNKAGTPLMCSPPKIYGSVQAREEPGILMAFNPHFKTPKLNGKAAPRSGRMEPSRRVAMARSIIRAWPFGKPHLQ